MISTDKYPEDYRIVTADEVRRSLLHHNHELNWLLDKSEGLFQMPPHVVYTRIQEIFRFLEEHELYLVRRLTQKQHYQDRSIAQLYRARDGVARYNHENWANTRLYSALAHTPLFERKMCLYLEPKAEGFIRWLCSALRALINYFTLLFTDGSNHVIQHYQYTGFWTVHVGERSRDNPWLLNPLYSERFYALLPQDEHVLIYRQTVALVRRYGSVRHVLDTNSLLQLREFAHQLTALTQKFNYPVLREQYRELMADRQQPKPATYSFYEYEGRHRQHFNTYIEPIEVGQWEVSNQPLIPSQAETRLLMALGRESNDLVTALVNTCARVRSYAMLQVTYERVRQNTETEDTVEESETA